MTMITLMVMLIMMAMQVMMVEETVYDDVVECDHSYDRQCHTSYTTTFEVNLQGESPNEDILITKY